MIHKKLIMIIALSFFLFPTLSFSQKIFILYFKSGRSMLCNQLKQGKDNVICDAKGYDVIIPIDTIADAKIVDGRITKHPRSQRILANRGNTNPSLNVDTSTPKFRTELIGKEEAKREGYGWREKMALNVGILRNNKRTELIGKEEAKRKGYGWQERKQMNEQIIANQGYIAGQRSNNKIQRSNNNLSSATGNNTASSAIKDPGPCIGDCGAEQGICIANCRGNGRCIGNCSSAHGRCVARCHR